jgi:hypothetical protein
MLVSAGKVIVLRWAARGSGRIGVKTRLELFLISVRVSPLDCVSAPERLRHEVTRLTS